MDQCIFELSKGIQNVHPHHFASARVEKLRNIDAAIFRDPKVLHKWPNIDDTMAPRYYFFTKSHVTVPLLGSAAWQVSLLK